MKGTEILRLVWLNIYQNKFKTVMTSIGIVVGAATIVMVIAIGRGGRLDVAEQFSSLNAGAIDVSYEYEGEETTSGGGFSFGAIGEFFSNAFGGGGRSPGDAGNSGGMADMGGNAGGDMGGGMGQNAGGGMGQNDGENAGGDMAGGTDGNERGERTEDVGENADGGFPGGTDEDAARDFPGGTDGNAEPGGFPGSGEEDAEAADEGTGREAMPDESGTGNKAGEGSEKAGTPDAVSETEDSGEEESIVEDRMNLDNIILSESDVEDIETYVPGLDGVTISYTAGSLVEGGNLQESQQYTIAGVKESYAAVSKLTMAAGEFISDDDDARKSKVCVLGSNAAKAVFGSVDGAYGETLYIDDRAFTVCGVLNATSAVSAGISPDETIFVPYSTGIKYITGETISPTITVLTDDVNAIDTIKEQVSIVLEENYSNAEFTFSDAGSKMEAAETSNRVLTMLLGAMAAIVFLVGGIGIMNVLFVSVKERTNEIGILKAIGASRGVILSEFLIESAAISLIGGILGVAVSFGVTPIVEYYGIRVEADITAWALALGFAVLTGTLFGIYPAWKASRLVPVDALNAE